MKKQISTILLAALLSTTIPVHAEGEGKIFGLAVVICVGIYTYFCGIPFYSKTQSQNNATNNTSLNEQTSSLHLENPLKKELEDKNIQKEPNIVPQETPNNITHAPEISSSQDKGKPADLPQYKIENPIEKELQEKSVPAEKPNNTPQQKTQSYIETLQTIKQMVLESIKREETIRRTHEDSGFDYNS